MESIGEDHKSRNLYSPRKNKSCRQNKNPPTDKKESVQSKSKIKNICIKGSHLCAATRLAEKNNYIMLVQSGRPGYIVLNLPQKIVGPF